MTRKKREIRRRSFRGLAPEARQAQRRVQLVAAGLELFGTQGYHETTVRQVCIQARLTERYFYESFKDREALMAAVYDDAVGRLRMRLLEALGKATLQPMAVAEAGIGEFFRFLKQDPRTARVLMIEILGVGAEADRLSRRATMGFGDLMQQFLELLFPEAAHKGNIDPTLVATGLVGATIHIAMRWTLFGFQQPVDEVLKAALSIYEAMIRTYGDPPPRKR